MDKEAKRFLFNDKDKEIFKVLMNVNTGLGNSAKSFIVNMNGLIESEESLISQKQRDYGLYLIYKYRKQINNIRLIEEATKKINAGEINFATDNDRIKAKKFIKQNIEQELDTYQINLF